MSINLQFIKKKYQFLSNDKFLKFFSNAINGKYQFDLSKLPLSHHNFFNY